MTSGFWKARRVFLTGHTGFKGSWLALWLKHVGAQVFGYSLPPPTTPSIFESAGLANVLDGTMVGDIRDLGQLTRAMADVKPDVVVHLAAQAIVFSSFEDPVGTFGSNVMGTVNVLESARHVDTIRTMLIVTSDKCYENSEVGPPRSESDAMGGDDPYSASKGCAELVTHAYRSSFFGAGEQHPVTVMSARAGNVIGGGDFARYRLIPDLVRGAREGRPVMIRNPAATRPWQHVLEPLSGYLTLIERAWEHAGGVAEGWNFGPAADDVREVGWVADRFADCWGIARNEAWRKDSRSFPTEKLTLQLDSTKVAARLGWQPRWTIEQTLNRVVDWYKREAEGFNAHNLIIEQIEDYVNSAPRAAADATQHTSIGPAS
ncbi:CDP-glucose 4,6-dehydratase [Bradyrhizobium sp. STM 3843]|uniref:CDP-glucose 4,6-dehydratase n=1 Tax=Bradyrhizobium sp. STM 3843 TaxID=551947 RepID=UPI00024066A5|nr:CDP-glucose 4,6-dehydratase [Bradyrhizobium sp. STM 3843]CCE04769.1 CDP-glucose 4,6-dehydratase [Bradyrhizobium sp. STM 3843]